MRAPVLTFCATCSCLVLGFALVGLGIGLGIHTDDMRLLSGIVGGGASLIINTIIFAAINVFIYYKRESHPVFVVVNGHLNPTGCVVWFALSIYGSVGLSILIYGIINFWLVVGFGLFIGGLVFACIYILLLLLIFINLFLEASAHVNQHVSVNA